MNRAPGLLPGARFWHAEGGTVSAQADRHVYVMLDAFGLFQLIRAAVDAAQQAVEHVVPV